MLTGIRGPIPASQDSTSPVLAPVLSDKWQLSFWATMLSGWLAIVFLLVSHTPLALTGTWAHLNAGRAVVESGSITDHLDYVPLSFGMPATNTSWLFDATSFGIANRFGLEGLCIANAIISFCSICLWAGLFYRASSNARYALFGVVILTLAHSVGFGAFQPRVVSGLLLAILFSILFGSWTSGDQNGQQATVTASKAASVFILFALWANFDLLSCAIGLIVLLTLAVAEAVSACRRTGFRGLLAVKPMSRMLLWQLAMIAVVLNPQGLRVLRHLASFELDFFLSAISRGQGLYLPSIQGMTFVLFVGFVWYWLSQSEDRPRVSAWLLIAVLGLITFCDSDAIYWLVPVGLLVLAPQLPSSEPGNVEPKNNEAPLRFAGTLFAALFLWCAFALSPVSSPILGGNPRPLERLMDRNAPLAIHDQLHNQQESPNEAVVTTVFAPAEWADWLSFGPRRMSFFANAELHLLPTRAQSDYLRIYRGESDWAQLLDRYAVSTLVIDVANQPRLARAVQRSGNWKLALESGPALAYRRVFDQGSDS